ncbi:hypothetical protein [Nostoc sp.]|uniref:hypothetical protein n=1 Tax=Nostoc sp. TaxID=1180 RepID=UPI003FA5731E
MKKWLWSLAGVFWLLEEAFPLYQVFFGVDAKFISKGSSKVIATSKTDYSGNFTHSKTKPI